MNKKIYTVIFSLIVISFIFGLGTGTYKTFPYSSLDYFKKIVLSEPEPNIEIMSSHIYDVDIKSLVKIKNEHDILEKRKNVINFIWNESTLPNTFPIIEENISDQNYQNIKNLQRIDKLLVEMDYEINSIAYHFIPEKKSNSLIIYHQGHGGDFLLGYDTIQFFVERGYSVLAFSMPLLGMNNQPVVYVDDIGPMILRSHNHFQFLETTELKPIKFFVEPIAVSLNYIDENFDYKNIHMLGISGGGWTTVLYPSIDTRVSHSYSVAGSYPLFMQSSFKTLGDYEVNLPELYSKANYLELYIMASFGNDRQFVQIFNEFDRCCWAGDHFKVYENDVKQIVDELENGKFEIWLDNTHKEHKISEYSLQLILNSIESNQM